MIQIALFVLVFTFLLFIAGSITKGIIRLISLFLVVLVLTLLAANLFREVDNPLHMSSWFNQSTYQMLIDSLKQINPPTWVSGMCWILAFIFTVIAATVGSTTRIIEGNEALVERLGRFHRRLTPGLSCGLIPGVDQVVVIASVREHFLELDCEAITADNVIVQCDVIVLWRIFELEKAYYAIDDVEEGVKNLVSTVFRSEIGRMTLQEIKLERNEIIRAMLESLDEATEDWGVKVLRVEIQKIRLHNDILVAMRQKFICVAKAEGEKQAAIIRAEGEKQAAIEEVKAINDTTSEFLPSEPESPDGNRPDLKAD